MCLNNKCFNFEDYEHENVLIIISGPGYLEYPWAFETALLLKNVGANVRVLDLSDLALPYAMRIKILGLNLPIVTRKIARKVLLKPKYRIENYISAILESRSIEFDKTKIYHLRPSFTFLKKATLLEYANQSWGSLNAMSILLTALSSQAKRKLTLTEPINRQRANNIKRSLLLGEIAADKIIESGDCQIFIANGRQPLSASLTSRLREVGRQVILYESAGGYIFPKVYDRRIDYFITSPANPEELQAKIVCEYNFLKSTESEIAELFELVRNRSEVAFTLNYLTETPTKFDKNKLSEGKNFAFFTTTDWEMSILYSDNYKKIFSNQIEVVKEILELIGESDKLFVRLHPSDPKNPADPDSEWDTLLMHPKIEVIPADSRIDSYELASYMYANFVWSSFLGFELALRQIPIAAVGDAFYGPCFGKNWLKTKADLDAFMQNPNSPELKPLERYASYLVNGGFKLSNSAIDQNRNIFIEGEQVDIPKRLFALFPEKLIRAIS